MQKKNIAIFGSTGSIGTQTLEVIAAHPDKFRVNILTAQENAALLIEQAIQFEPAIVVIANEQKYETVKKALSGKKIQVLAGENALIEAASKSSTNIMLAAISGFAGLAPTLAAIEQGTTIALANKETLVVAGDLVMAAARSNHATIIPVDSEHSAIFQCLSGEPSTRIEKIILTASGGPFRGMKAEHLANIKKEQALKHPNWSMGAKITIDSASLMNKGLEIIEARWLFDLHPEQIEVVVHPQSIIHSLVQFVDGSLKAQLGLPDMKLPIQYALGYPDRLENNFRRFSFNNYPALTFEQPDLQTFRNLGIALDALRRGGNAPCVMNAANEVVVQLFLRNEIGFLEMPDVIGEVMQNVPFIQSPTLHDYYESDAAAREMAATATRSKVFNA